MTDSPEAIDRSGAAAPSRIDTEDLALASTVAPPEPPPSTPSLIFDTHSIGDDGDALHITAPPSFRLRDWKVVGTGLVVICWERDG